MTCAEDIIFIELRHTTWVPGLCALRWKQLWISQHQGMWHIRSAQANQ